MHSNSMVGGAYINDSTSTSRTTSTAATTNQLLETPLAEFGTMDLKRGAAGVSTRAMPVSTRAMSTRTVSTRSVSSTRTVSTRGVGSTRAVGSSTRGVGSTLSLQHNSVAKSTTNINFSREQHSFCYTTSDVVVFSPSTRPPPTAPPTPCSAHPPTHPPNFLGTKLICLSSWSVRGFFNSKRSTSSAEPDDPVRKENSLRDVRKEKSVAFYESKTISDSSKTSIIGTSLGGLNAQGRPDDGGLGWGAAAVGTTANDEESKHESKQEEELDPDQAALVRIADVLQSQIFTRYQPRIFTRTSCSSRRSSHGRAPVAELYLSSQGISLGP